MMKIKWSKIRIRAPKIKWPNIKLKRPKRKPCVLPEDTNCRNCDAKITGRYCCECGQDVLAGRGRSVKQLVAQFIESVLAFNRKTPRTLSYLMTRPGFLSNEYCAGRIKKYVHPAKLFWMSTLVFFALVTSQFNSDFIIIEINAENYGDNLLANLTKYGQFILFLLIPVFTWLLALFFRSNKLYYMHHMVFAVHFHSFLWIFFSLLLIIEIFTSNLSSLSVWFSVLILLIPTVYLGIAFNRFYQSKWWIATWKTVAFSLSYFISALVIAVFLILFLSTLR